jgi:universal stress protein E
MTNDKIQRILIAVRPWERHLPLAPAHARFLAEKLSAEITLLTCVPESHLALGFAWTEGTAVTALQTEWFDRAEKQLDMLAEPLREAGLQVRTRVSSHTPVYRGILEEAESWGADLVVVGVHEPKPVPHTRLTDVDWQLMRLVPCPLLLVADPNGESYRTILAAVDPLHRHAEPAGLDEAVLAASGALGEAVGAQLLVVNVYPDPEEYEFASSVEVTPGVYYGTENIPALHRKAVDALTSAHGIPQSQAIVEPGEPGEVIVETARAHKADLIVLGAVKRGRIEAALLGSTAEAVVGAANCDVLLVKPPSA